MNNYSTFVKLMFENIAKAINTILNQFNGVTASFTYNVSDNVTRK